VNVTCVTLRNPFVFAAISTPASATPRLKPRKPRMVSSLSTATLGSFSMIRSEPKAQYPGSAFFLFAGRRRAPRVGSKALISLQPAR